MVEKTEIDSHILQNKRRKTAAYSTVTLLWEYSDSREALIADAHK